MSDTSPVSAIPESEGEGRNWEATAGPSGHSKPQPGACSTPLSATMRYVCFGGADLTSTSYVYSSLVEDDSRRVVGRAAVHTPVPHLRAGDVQVADHIPLGRDHLADAVAAALEDRVVIQGPRDRGQWCSLHVAHEGHRFCWTHHFFTEGRNNLGSSICRETCEQVQVAFTVKQLPSAFPSWLGGRHSIRHPMEAKMHHPGRLPAITMHSLTVSIRRTGV